MVPSTSINSISLFHAQRSSCFPVMLCLCAFAGPAEGRLNSGARLRPWLESNARRTQMNMHTCQCLCVRLRACMFLCVLRYAYVCVYVYMHVGYSCQFHFRVFCCSTSTARLEPVTAKETIKLQTLCIVQLAIAMSLHTRLRFGVGVCEIQSKMLAGKVVQCG